jgi:hypothetical protein
MPKGLQAHRRGHIPDLRLPSNAWYALRRENIRTIGQLRAVADQLERFAGIGPVTARVIRAELARVASTVPDPEGPQG